MYTIDQISMNKLTKNDIENLYLVNNYLVQKYNFLDVFKNNSEFKNLFLSQFTESYNKLFIVRNDSFICGILSWIKSADWSGKELYKLTICLCDSVINEPLLESLNGFIQKMLLEYKNFAIVTYNDELKTFIESLKHKINSRSNYYTLKREDIYIESLNNIIKEGKFKTDLSIKYTDLISEEYIDQYCNLFMETMNDMTDAREDGYVKYVVTPEKQRKINESNKKRNITHHCYMIFNSSNEMVAHSNVSVNNNDFRFPYQFMIGVKREYRGRNLGKWLYASMYKKLLDTVDFDKISVCHHVENHSAISISKWAGYKFSYLETIYIV